jgi:predicted enzyme related to lactoylglutathione lyase
MTRNVAFKRWSCRSRLRWNMHTTALFRLMNMSCRAATKNSALLFVAFMALQLSACSNYPRDEMAQKQNPALYFEIPVTDMTRAVAFYQQVFGFDFELEEIHGNQMALMPFALDGSGISGALAQGEIYKPTVNGTLIYLHTASIDNTLNAAQLAGAKVLFPKTRAGDYAYVAEIQDSEGNRIGLMEPLE